MPYYKNKNILFIHIPKTGGTSIENFFFEKFNVIPCFQSLYSDGQVLKEIPYSLQHSTFNDIKINNKYFNINFNNLTIISSVRNPYDRIISHLFFKKLIKKDENPKIVEQLLENLLIRKNYFKYDNHITPQYIFIINKNIILKKCIILKMENLQSNMNRIGYNDFNFFENVSNQYEYNNIHNIKYFKYLNDKSINLINNFYKYDFLIFNYKMININDFYTKIQEIQEIQEMQEIQEIQEIQEMQKMQEIQEIQEIKEENENEIKGENEIKEENENEIKEENENENENEIKEENENENENEIKEENENEIKEENIKILIKDKIDEYKIKINNTLLSNEEIKNKRKNNLKLNNIINQKILLSKKVNINKFNIKKINNKMKMIFIKNKTN